MNRVWAIAFKDLRSAFRNPVALTMMLVAPLVLASLLGLAFGGSEGYSIPATKVVAVNLDKGAAGQAGAATGSAGTQNFGREVIGVLQSEELSELLTLEVLDSEEEARARVDAGKVPVAVIIPDGFSTALLTEGAPDAGVVIYRNPTETLGPSIVQGIVQQVMDQLNGARAAAAAVIHVGMELGQDQAALGQAAATAAAAFASQSSEQLGSAVDMREPQVSDAQTKQPGVTGLILSGMMIFFMFIAAANVARTILDEDFYGTLARLFTTPTRRGTILAGKYTSVFLTVFTQAVILLLAGWLIFRIDWGSLPAVALLVLDGAAVAAGLAVMLNSFFRTPAQAGAATAGVFVFLGLVGGNFVGTVEPGGFFGTVRLFTPNGWLLTAWDQVMRGGQVSDIIVPLLVVLGFALVTFAVGVIGFRRRYA